jgi:DNA-nicking Smr family endonuclease
MGQDEEVVVVPIEDSLDLHAFQPRDVPIAVEGYLEAARERGFREVRLIHGKGKGVQRAIVHRILAASPHVERFEDAPPGRGTWGATLAWLRPAH